ncbi:MAG TPA: MEDS domain-containing protein [Bacteroidales bacterium]|nr:MEDS domain-containing protein [Bacteroidales bacterium]
MHSHQELTSDLSEHFAGDFCHVCLIFDNDEQRKKIVSQYMQNGFKKGDLIRFASNHIDQDEVLSWLSELNIELPENKEAFMVMSADDFYCSGGEFNPPALIDRIEKRLLSLKKDGYHGSRVCGDMSWALKKIPGAERLLEYELLLNTVETDIPHTGMCQYDARLFDGATLFNILQVHPYIIAQGQIVRNPFYKKSGELD